MSDKYNKTRQLMQKRINAARKQLESACRLAEKQEFGSVMMISILREVIGHLDEIETDAIIVDGDVETLRIAIANVRRQRDYAVRGWRVALRHVKLQKDYNCKDCKNRVLAVKELPATQSEFPDGLTDGS